MLQQNKGLDWGPAAAPQLQQDPPDRRLSPRPTTTVACYVGSGTQHGCAQLATAALLVAQLRDRQ